MFTEKQLRNQCFSVKNQQSF
uniref:Uncharacterized protein n=1 Tax=Anguilla anguilla TaxID=7936 RepID=A0A0E9RRM0_ANGAN